MNMLNDDINLSFIKSESFEKLLLKLNICCYLADENGMTLFSSKSEIKLLGYKKINEIVGKKYRQDLWYNPEERQPFEELLNENGRVENYICHFKKKNGDIIWIDVNAFYYFENDCKKLFGFYKEVTHQQAIEIYREQILKYPSSLLHFFNSLFNATSKLFDTSMCSYWQYNKSTKKFTLSYFTGFEAGEQRNLQFEKLNLNLDELLDNQKRYKIIDKLIIKEIHNIEFIEKHKIKKYIIISVFNYSEPASLDGILLVNTPFDNYKIQKTISKSLSFEISMLLNQAMLIEEQRIQRKFSEIEYDKINKPDRFELEYLAKILIQVKSEFNIEYLAFYKLDDIIDLRLDLITSSGIESFNKQISFYCENTQTKILPRELLEGKSVVFYSNESADQYIENFIGKYFHDHSLVIVPINSKERKKTKSFFVGIGKKDPIHNTKLEFSRNDIDLLSSIMTIVSHKLYEIDNIKWNWSLLRAAAHTYIPQINDINETYSNVIRQLNVLSVKQDSKDRIERQITRNKDKLKKMLLFSKKLLGDDKFRMNRELIDLEIVVKNSFEQIYPRLRAYGLIPNETVRYFGFDKNLIWANRNEIEEIFESLIENAAKYLDPKGCTEFPMISVSAREDQSGAIKVTFEDTGIGIKKEDLLDVFRWGFRSKAAKDLEEEGFGIGLGRVKMLIEEYGGNIQVGKLGRANNETCTQFHITFPYEMKLKPKEVKYDK